MLIKNNLSFCRILNKGNKIIYIERGQRVIRGIFYPTIHPTFIDIKQQKQNKDSFADFNNENDEKMDQSDSPQITAESSTSNTRITI